MRSVKCTAVRRQENRMPPRTRSVVELRRELEKSERELARLVARRAIVADKLSALDRRIAALGGPAAAGAFFGRGRPGLPLGAAQRRRPVNGKPLLQFVRQALAGAKAGMRVRDVVAAVRRAGYKTSSRGFYGIVATMLRDKANFTRLDRGLYKLA